MQARIGIIASVALGLLACGGSADVGSGRLSGGTGGAASGSTGSSGSTTTTGTTTSTTGGGTTGSAGTSAGSGSTSSSLCDTQRCVVYASADHDLYQVDPQTLAETHLCTFNGALTSSSTDVVTDTAVASDGTLYAITKTKLFTVDPASCAATLVQSLSQAGTRWVGLTFTRGGTLLAADGTGNVVTIDPASGLVTPVGSFGGSYVCSGDLVAINDAAGSIYATAKDTSCSGCTDLLVSLDPVSYQATVIGDVGHSSVFGLGFWGGQLFGFTHAGDTLQIDPATGQSTVISSGSSAFSGGATTPLAPVLR